MRRARSRAPIDPRDAPTALASLDGAVLRGDIHRMLESRDTAPPADAVREGSFWKRPLTSLGRGIVVIGVGAMFASFDFFAPDGSTWVFEQARWLRLRWFGLAFVAYGVALVALTVLSRIVARPHVPTESHSDRALQRPRGAPPRVACKKCGELFDVSMLEERTCDDCRGVQREGRYR